MNKPEYYIEKLGLIKHPEGGWYKETYRAEEKIKKEHLPGRFSGNRHHSTSIYFLLTSKDFSAFHRIKSDEIWHFYDGEAVTIHMIDGKGKYYNVKLGNNTEEGEVFQFTVPHGVWFAAEVEKPDSYALAGCTVAPGFDYNDFELGSKEDLLEQYPHLDFIITKFTRN